MTFKRSTLLVLLFASIGSAVQGDPLPPADGAVRVATFNIQELGLKKLRAVDSSGNGSDPQLLAAAAILRTIRPDVVLLNEIDYTGPADSDAPPDASRKAAQGDAGELFVKQYLSNRRDGLERLTYPHRCY
ncbi:MAG TPA: endonuclease/exonuclease/phosphatase family protein, partial [Pirellulales bacterium]